MKINIVILIAAQAAFFGCKEEATTQAEGERNKSLTTLSEADATPVGQWNWKSTCGGFAPGCEYASETMHKKIEFTGSLFTGVVGGTDYKNVPYTTDSTQAGPDPNLFYYVGKRCSLASEFAGADPENSIGRIDRRVHTGSLKHGLLQATRASSYVEELLFFSGSYFGQRNRINLRK
ncbi:hypothetical protein [Chryseolinea lacunae]|uniref:Uncharacterized protein n=1 Tax=Chryseolinea lacunae TaxID=2801331 RepID=A0ABS1KUM4_9BACT|nr:hypothetical protein [Chryseolinea lacunae]MBL0743178.1 hypothetical protein [Chryseolinea lacunae]